MTLFLYALAAAWLAAGFAHYVRCWRDWRWIERDCGRPLKLKTRLWLEPVQLAVFAVGGPFSWLGPTPKTSYLVVKKDAS